MKFGIFLFLFFNLIQPSPVFSNSAKKAVVSKMRGRIIASLPNGKKKILKKGDSIPANTKLESKAKSFAVITFVDQTKVTLGPSSKILLKAPSTKGKPGLINLLKGQLRSNVKPEKSRKGNKLIVNTRAAAIGVRGTETVLSYNPKSNRLVTGGITGKVLITPPLDTLTYETAEKKVSYDNPSSYTLPPKTFSSVSNSNGNVKVSLPRKINPTQYNLLRKNPIPSFNNKRSISSANNQHRRSSQLPNIPITAVNDPFTSSNQDLNSAGNNPAGNSQLPAGSYIDLKSASIIPPTAGSEYDPNTGTWLVDSKYGSIAADGSYVPPAGLKLNDSHEFVVDKSRGLSSSDLKSFSNLSQELNSSMNESLNSEAIYINPDTNSINHADTSNSGSDGNQTTQQTRETNNTTIIVEANQDSDDGQSDNIDIGNSCPGNICDKFDTSPPTSDQSNTSNTLVQFRIRVNQK